MNIRSEWESLTAEIKFNEQRQRSYNLLVELFSTERDVAHKKVESRERMVKNWQVEVQKRRRQEASQTLEDAQDAIFEVSLLPKIIQDQFNINIQLSTELENVTREESVLTEKYEGYQSRFKALEAEFGTVKKRVESAVLTEAIGLALRQQRLNLPSADRYFEESDARQVRMSVISERQIGLDRLLRELSDPKALADRLIGSVSFLTDVNRQSFDSKIQELVTNRLDVIQKLKSVYDRIFKLIQDIEFTEQKLVNMAEDFGDLLDRHLLWIRSSKPVRLGDIQKLKVSLAWFWESTSWHRFIKDMGRSFRQSTAVWTVGLLVGLFLIFSRRWIRRILKDIAICIGQQVEDSFLLTMKALALTVLLAAFWPFLLAFPAFQLTSLREADPFSTGIAGGLISAARRLILLVLLFNICRQNGLGQAHFQWPESALRTLKRNLGWLFPIIAVSSFFLGTMDSAALFEYNDPLATFALIIQALAVSIFAALILRFRGASHPY